MTLIPARSAPIRRRGKPVVTYDERQALATLSAADRHLVKRFSWGFTPALAAQVKAAGGGQAWFAKQLTPAKVADAPGDDINTWFPSLRFTPKQIFQNQDNDVQGSWEVATDHSRWTVARRIASNRQVHEVMVDFWSNLLNVSLFHDDAIFWRMDYDRVIRANALTSFELAAAGHDHAPGHGSLPRQRVLVEGGTQREPRPRAARAPHGGRRRRLHRGPREGVGADAHRLPGRRVVAVVPRLLRHRLARHPAGQGAGVQPRQPVRRRPRRDRSPTSRTWPGTRPPPTGWRAGCAPSSSPTSRRRRSSGPSPGRTSPTTPRSSRRCAPSSTTPTSPPAQARRCARPTRTTWPPCAPSASGRGSRSTTARSPTRCTGSTARAASRRTSGPRRTATPRPTAPGPVPAGSSPASRCTATWPPGGGPPRRRRSRRTPRCCRRCRPPSRRSSTTRPGGCSGSGRATPYATGSRSCSACR